MPNAPREHWSSRTGFVLAAVGSAVGLGNMWRFSYLTAENGGAAFVILYLAIAAIVGLPVLLAELVIGRGAQTSPIRALAHYGGAAWKPLGAVFVAAGFLILSYYSVIAGWTVRYAGIGLLAGFELARFDDIKSGWDAFGYHLFFMAGTIAVVAGGVKAGIERCNLVLMPMLALIVVGLALYAATLDGAAAGYRYYFETDFSEMLRFSAIKDATGQVFFSLSLGMGAMLTYASYLDRKAHLPNESLAIAASDTSIAFVAGLVVFPLIFALGLSSEVSGSTLGALFITLPHAFAGMGPVGRLVGFLFFVTLIAAALTSAISLLEVVVASTVDGLGWSRRRAALVMGGAIALLGAPSAWSTEFLGVVDSIANNLFLLGGGLALSIFVGWIMRDPVAEVRAGAEGVPWFFLWRYFLRFAVPLALGAVLVQAVPDTVAAVAGLFK
jgi:NSS family neurotransmitter:Na+ symporter